MNYPPRDQEHAETIQELKYIEALVVAAHTPNFHLTDKLFQ